MHAHSKRSSPNADLKSMQSILDGQQPSYRITELWRACTHEDGDYVKMMQSCILSSKDPDLWRDLEPHEQMANDIFRVCARPASVVFELLAHRQKGWPFLLFQLLEDASSAAFIVRKSQTDSACLMDLFSQSFMATYHNEELLTSEDALQELAALAAVLVGNTWEIETAHSKHRRRAKGSPQTHVPTLADVAMWNAAWGAPSFVKPAPEDCCLS